MKNKNELPECPVATTVSLIGSKWKLLIIRNYKTNPPKVEYGMTDLGLELSKMLDIMASFGNFYKSQI